MLSSNSRPPSPLLILREISKYFPGVKALDGVDFQLYAGEIHALMGGNGAGKSALIKSINGIYRVDEGKMVMEDKPFQPSRPIDAVHAGISTVFQEINLVPFLSVAENIFLGRQPYKWGRIDWNKIQENSKSILEKMGIDMDVGKPLISFSTAIQQMVAIARALSVSAKILILDEPTASLDRAEVKQLFEILKELKRKNMSILFVTHFLDEVYEISDRITVLRNGRMVGEYETTQLPKMTLISKMLGTSESQASQSGSRPVQRKLKENRKTLLHASHIERKGSIHEMDLEIKSNEVLGLAGLLGSGRTELARLLFGVDQIQKGSLSLEGKPARFKTPEDAVKRGIGFCPEDRKLEGIIPEFSVKENMLLALQAQNGMFRQLSNRKQNEITEKFIKLLNIKTPDANQLIKNLSGGNQQKVIIGRWLASRIKFLILDEPTRGIDIAGKEDIKKLIYKLSNDGLAVLFISSEFEEIVQSADRVVVLRDRKKIKELEGDGIDTQVIMQTIADETESATAK